jgi:hypothetical protein
VLPPLLLLFLTLNVQAIDSHDVAISETHELTSFAGMRSVRSYIQENIASIIGQAQNGIRRRKSYTAKSLLPILFMVHGIAYSTPLPIPPDAPRFYAILCQ